MSWNPISYGSLKFNPEWISFGAIGISKKSSPRLRRKRRTNNATPLSPGNPDCPNVQVKTGLDVEKNDILHGRLRRNFGHWTRQNESNIK